MTATCAVGADHSMNSQEFREDLARISEGVCPPCHTPLLDGTCVCCGLGFRLSGGDGGALAVTVTIPTHLLGEGR